MLMSFLRKTQAEKLGVTDKAVAALNEQQEAYERAVRTQQ